MNTMSNKEIIEQNVQQLFDESYFKSLKTDAARDDYMDEILRNNRGDSNYTFMTMDQIKKEKTRHEVCIEQAILSERERACARSKGIEWKYGGAV